MNLYDILLAQKVSGGSGGDEPVTESDFGYITIVNSSSSQILIPYGFVFDDNGNQLKYLRSNASARLAFFKQTGFTYFMSSSNQVKSSAYYSKKIMKMTVSSGETVYLINITNIDEENAVVTFEDPEEEQ